MPSSAALDRKIRGLKDIDDIVGVMRAYAGAAVRKADGVVANIRVCEDNALKALAILAARAPLAPGAAAEGSRILAAFGSSLGLCGTYNERMADEVAGLVREGDALFVIGGRLFDLVRGRKLPCSGNRESPAGIDGIRAALRDSADLIWKFYAREEYFSLLLVYTTVTEGTAGIAVRQVLPPPLDPRAPAGSAPSPPYIHEAPEKLFPLVMEEYLYMALHRAYAEALRSENWYRLRTMEGAGENLKRRVGELNSLYHYVRQEEVTEEMLEILSGLFRG